MSQLDQGFDEFCREMRGRVRHDDGHGMTPMSDIGLADEFRKIAYPVPPEREEEIKRMHREDQRRKFAEYRGTLIAFASACLDGKKGRTAEEIAKTVLNSVDVAELIDRSGYATAENCCNLVLWDIRRRVAWASAMARGETVQSKLKSRAECLALYNARKIADEFQVDNEFESAPRFNPVPPPPDYGYQQRGMFDDMVGREM